MTEKPVSEMTEIEIAEGIKGGSLQSPTHLNGFSLFAMRITGTGCAYRLGRDEYVWRDKSLYCNDAFLKRCNGLPVIWEHPEHSMLNSEEFNNRVVGTVLLPYIKDDEVWGIVRMFDADAITIIINKQMSTSPGVVFGKTSGNRKIEIDDGDLLLIEGNPKFIDHLAICAQGVWDKMDEPCGIISETTGDKLMTEAEQAAQDEQEAKARKDAQARKDAEAEKPPAWAADTFGRMMDRMDAFEKRFDSMRKDSDDAEAEKKAKDTAAAAEAAAAQKDSDEKEAKARLDAVEEAVKKATPVERSDAEASEMADAQAECDSVAMAFGKQARAPLPGETPVAYRRRLASEYKSHSPRWKAVDLATLPDEALGNAVQDIYKDAQVAARAPESVPDGQMREIKSRSPAGHLVSEFVGAPLWMEHFKHPVSFQVPKGGITAKPFGVGNA